MIRNLMALTLLPILLAGCGWKSISLPPPKDYQTIAVDPRRDTDTARELNSQGAALIKEGHFEQAESVLREALAADVFFGPAHNNLGSAYYQQKKYYLAAWEYQYAAKLMPNSPEPKNNLGLVLEAANKLDEAAKSFEAAVAAEPDNPQYTANLAKLCVRTHRNDDRTRELLTEMISKDTRPEWVDWARERLALMGHTAKSPTSQEDK